jgi:AbrB family looped-hinge helix DNA binding protein
MYNDRRPLKIKVSGENSMRARVAEKGQVTIPKELCDRLGIQTSTILDFREEAGRLVVEKVEDDEPIQNVIGCVKTDRRTDDIVRELRGI